MKQMHESMLKAVQDGDVNPSIKRSDTDHSDSFQNLKEEFDEL